MTQQLASKQRCPRCGKKAILSDTEIAELICGRCGYVISEGLEYLRAKKKRIGFGQSEEKDEDKKKED